MHDLNDTPLDTLKVMCSLATALARHLDTANDSDADRVWAEAIELEQAVKDREAAMSKFAPLDAIQDTLALRERHAEHVMEGVGS